MAEQPAEVAERFRKQLIRVASGEESVPALEPIGDRPVFLLAPNSYLGTLYGPAVAGGLKNAVAAVDDFSTAESIHGLPRWSAYQFATRARDYPGALALDFSVSRFATAMFRALCAEARLPRRDFVAALGELGLAAVYQPAAVMRQQTLDALDRFLAVGELLADDLSRATLYAALLLRVLYDRAPLQSSLVSSEDEYFSTSVAGSTFRVRPDEWFCDAGAHVGLVTAKFLGACGWNYGGIHAFEPDRTNFRNLQKMCLLPLHDFHLHNRALSDVAETVAFAETGTMGSHITPAGARECRTVRLDDEVERVSFLKMDIEGFEARALRGARSLIARHRPRIAVTAYHNACDLLDIVHTLREINPGYELRLRHHYNYYYDMVLYACEPGGWDPA